MTTAAQPITRSDLREELQVLRDEFRQRYATRADVAELQVELHQMETRLIKWMVGLMVGSIAVASTIALLVQRLVGS